MREEIIGDCRLILGDAAAIIPQLPPATVDLLWTDPPYGNGNHDGDFNSRLNAHRGLQNAPIANDTPDTMREVVDSVLRASVAVLKPDCCCCCCCCCGGGPRPTFAWLAERMDRDGFRFFHSVIWNKVNPGLGWRYRRQHEMVMIAHLEGGKVKWANDAQAVPNIFELMPPRERHHPNEKPLAMVEHFVRLHSHPGDMVLDPFMGSGTTGVACVRLGRRFTGIEIDQAHFDTACKRIEAATKEPRLPLPEPKMKQEAFV